MFLECGFVSSDPAAQGADVALPASALRGSDPEDAEVAMSGFEKVGHCLFGSRGVVGVDALNLQVDSPCRRGGGSCDALPTSLPNGTYRRHLR